MVRTTTTLTDVGTTTGPEAAIRDLALFLVGHLPRLADTGAATLAETTLRYRDSALSVHRGAHHRCASRAVEDLLTRPGMLLLLWSDAPTWSTSCAAPSATSARWSEPWTAPTGRPRTALVDPDGVIGRAYGVGAAGSAGSALIRPAGHLGLVAPRVWPAGRSPRERWPRARGTWAGPVRQMADVREDSGCEARTRAARAEEDA